jgi:uncharacterized protein (DUF1684 family)
MKALLALLVFTLAGAAATDPAYVEEVDAWHAGRIERLQRPGSWLTLVGLFSLPEGTSSFGTDPDAGLRLEGEGPAHIGDLVVAGTTARFVAAETVTLEGNPVDEIDLEPDNSGSPTVLEAGPISFYLIIRHGRPYLRVKDSSVPLLQEFDGIDRWSVTEDWRVVARWVEYETPQKRMFPDVLGVPEEAEVTGEARFSIDGKEYALYPNSVGDDWMYWVFGDATNGVTTYGGGRFLYSGLPDAEGQLVLDFNRSYNPPCVFTPYATCPLPADDNVLDVEITAGEKLWGEKH